MKRLIPLLALCSLLLLGADDCNVPDPDAPPVSPYCYGNDYSILNNIEYGYERDGISGGIAAILQGDPSGDMRSTVQVLFGQSYCTGVLLNPTTVLTAGHCGYAPQTVHTIRAYKREGDSLVVAEQVVEESHTVHPDYLEYTRTGDQEKRKADLMIVKLQAPIETIPPLSRIYDPTFAKFCNGLVAQGFGRHEGSFRDIRETQYVITSTQHPKYLTSRAADVPDDEKSGRICFGDSGGPLYADVGGVPQLAGITTTTMSSDCLVGGNHVNAKYFEAWIAENSL
jgi:hypothetical protein